MEMVYHNIYQFIDSIAYQQREKSGLLPVNKAYKKFKGVDTSCTWLSSNAGYNPIYLCNLFMKHKQHLFTYISSLYNEVFVSVPVHRQHVLYLSRLPVVGLSHQVVSIVDQQPLYLVAGQHTVVPLLLVHCTSRLQRQLVVCKTAKENRTEVSTEEVNVQGM